MTENIIATDGPISFDANKLQDRLVAIGIPSPERIDYRFYTCLIDLITQTSRFVPIGMTQAVGSRIAFNRNVIVENAKKIGATDLLWIDSDSHFPINALMTLLMHDKDVVCATTCRRQGKDRGPICAPMDLASIQPNQVLVKMRQIGMPFMLTKMSVFDSLEKPYFAEPPRKMTDIEGEQELVGEDEYFCEALLKAGFDIWCDMELSMQVGHIGSTVLYIENPPNAPEGKIDEVL